MDSLLQLDDLRQISRLAFTEQNLLSNLCKSSYYEFLKVFWDVIVPEKLVDNWHIQVLCNEFQDVMERVFRGERRKHDLLVNIPPGTSKSTVFSVCGPAWAWCRQPSLKFICASFAQAVSMDLSRRCRDVVDSDLYRELFPDDKYRLRSDQNAKSNFMTRAGGLRYAIGTGGAVTGIHAHMIIIDDPIDPQQSASELELKRTNDWMTQTISSRKVDKSVTPTILVQQRLHEDDPSGYKIAHTPPSQLRHLCFPAELTEDVKPLEFRKYYKNGLFDQKRMNKATLRQIRNELGEYGYAGQYLQTPAPPGGGVFQVNKMRVVDTCEGVTFKKLVRYWDKAATANAGCYTVGTLMGLDKTGGVWVLDVVRGQWDAGKRENIIVATAMSDGTDVRIGVEQEPGSGGKESALDTVKRLAGYAVEVDKVQGKKEARADPFASQMNNGNVYMLKREWNRAYVEELAHFPFGKYKDQVDSSSGGYSMLSRKVVRIGQF